MLQANAHALQGQHDLLTEHESNDRRISQDVEDVYFSADVETDGPIPGPYSMLSFAIVLAGRFDGTSFTRPPNYDDYFYCELKPISERYQEEALRVNKLDRTHLSHAGSNPVTAMSSAFDWIMAKSYGGTPVLAAYPLSFDWTWLFWYFTMYCDRGSPFNYSRCYDIKTAVAVKAKARISHASRSRLPANLASKRLHTHHAIDDAIEQAEIFANVFDWNEK